MVKKEYFVWRVGINKTASILQNVLLSDIKSITYG